MADTPTSVKVGPYTYTIEPDPELLDCERLAECDERRLRIRYYPDQHPTQLRSSLLHEILHACCLSAGIGLTDRVTQEALITRAEPWILGVLRDNDGLAAWLAG